MLGHKLHLQIFLLIVLSVIISGCSIFEIREQTEEVENRGIVSGVVKTSTSQKGEIIVLQYRVDGGVLVLENQRTVSKKGDYKFTVEPASYTFAAFVDANNDGMYQDGEHGGFLGAPEIVTVADGEKVELDSIVISGPVLNSAKELNKVDNTFAIVKNIGLVISLDDPIFNRENYSMGMWRPIDFLEQVEGGLFLLQPYQADKIPVVFVHGVNGGPGDLQTTIDSLDTTKFQPWVLYYPSGFRLDSISDYFMQAVVTLQKEHHFDHLAVVAHSMGGLITRSFVKKYLKEFPEKAKSLKFVMTVNSPMGGIHSAAVGLKHSPIISAAWYDVDPDSEFLKDLHVWQWPKSIPYHLVFSFKDGESGDGVASLQSQIPLKLQSEAKSMYGFSNDHVGTLSDPEFLTVLNKLLSDYFKK